MVSVTLPLTAPIPGAFGVIRWTGGQGQAMSTDEEQPAEPATDADGDAEQQATKEKGKARGGESTPPEPGGGKPREGSS